MKLRILLFIWTLLPLSVFSSEPKQFNYLEFSKLDIQLGSPVEDASGYGIDAKWTPNEIIYLSATYQDYDNTSLYADRLIIGIGSTIEVNNYITPFGQMDYIHINSGLKNTSIKISQNQWRLSAGVSGALNNISYKIGLSRYYVNDNNIKDYATVYLAELYYSINNHISLGIETESDDDENEDVISIAVRYHF